MSAVRFRVTGYVQGVGFRNYVVETAEALKLDGEVWNTRDGAVEGIASGAKLEIFLRMLDKGPGRVDGVTSNPTDLAVGSGFGIGPTR